ncbi:MAG: polysaccharide export protein [Alphaproteobacteria bacterium]|nr:polysaccharide export protein [Alphaproteobacteria bacterium]
MKFRFVLFSLGSIALAGCSTIPTAGPTVSDVLNQAAVNGQRYFDLVDVDNHVVTTLLSRPAGTFPDRFLSYGKPPAPKIGIGDTVSVSIWEAAGGGLFGAPAAAAVPGAVAGGAAASIPSQVVGPDGGISVPFAGRVPVAGRTPLQVQNEIEQRLAQKAIEPQVIVTVANSVNDLVTVTGDVSNAHVPLSVGGTRLLDVLVSAGGGAGGGAAAGAGATGGGPKAPIYETFVRLSRDGVTATIPMEELISDPAEGIYAWPGDILTVADVPQTYSVFGATTTNNEVPFGAPKLTLVEALAKAGGLIDARADPQGVFLFRFEPPAVVGALNVPPLGTGPNGTSPVVYHLNLKEAKNYFYAERFPIKDKDVIYVANAPLTELQKVFTLINTVTGPVITGVVTSRAVSGGSGS